MTDFRFESIKEMLLGHTQPWRKENNFGERHYYELLKETAQMKMPEMFFSLRYDSYIQFTPRIRYYCRLVDNETAQQLIRAKQLIDTDGSEQLTKYVLKVIRENVVTLIKDAVRQCSLFAVDVQWFSGGLTDFVSQREEKEYLIILYYIIASLACCWMEIQNLYCYVLDDTEIYDVCTFYANVTGWRDNPLVKIEMKEDNISNKRPKVTYCSFLYNNNDQEEWNISMQAFYNKLILYNLIDPYTDKAAFLNVFRGKGTRAVITWTGKTATLHAIISKGVTNGWLTTYPSSSTHWDVVTCRFIDTNGTPIPNLGSKKDNKGDIEMVEDILSTLKS